jgi:predicted component of type VI protein secretion system
VNGKKLTAHEPYTLKNGDLVKVGPLTFAVSIEGAPVASTASTAGPSRKTGSIDDVNHDEIDTWLVSDASKEPPERPSGVYSGDTMTIESYKSKEKPESKSAMTAAKPAAPATKVVIPPVKLPVPGPDDEPEPETEERIHEEIEAYQEDDGIEDLSQKVEAELDMPEDMIDESNPFYVKKKSEAAPAAAAKGPQKDSSDAANDILRRMMDRRKASKS